MKTKGFLAAVALAAAAAPAHAIPITFDIAGTLRDTVNWDLVTNTQSVDLARAGTAFSVQFTIDTELFGPPAETNNGMIQLRQFSPLTPEGLTADVVIGGERWDTNPYANNRAVIGVGDSLGQVCNPNCRHAPDQFNLSLVSDEGSAPQAAQRRALHMSFVATSNPGAGDYGGDWFDFDEVTTLEQVLQLPLVGLNPLSIRLQDYLFDCAETCVNTTMLNTTLDVTGVTRTVASVPEPGTLALMGAGLGFSFALRRRREKLLN